MQKKKFGFLIQIILLWFIFSCCALSDQNTRTITNVEFERFPVKGDFDEVKELLQLAITERGIKISNTSFISKMLERTRKEVGASSSVYKNAEAIEFCSATLSYNMLSDNPHNIIYCPYIVYIYELAKNPGVVFLAYRKIPVNSSDKTQRALQAINELVQGIVRQAVDE